MKKLFKVLLPLALAAVMVLSIAGVAFAYSRATTVKGHVKDTKGAPVSGVEVKIEDTHGNGGSVTTDSNGYFEIIYTAEIGDLEVVPITATKNGYKTGTGSVNMEWGTPSDVDAGTITIEREKYNLKVKGGSGGGLYKEGTVINITANPAPSGSEFKSWKSSGGGTFGDVNSATTTFTMPEEDVTISVVNEAITSAPTEAPTTDPTPSDAPAMDSTPTAAPTTESAKSPKTGGEMDTALLLTLMGIAAAGIAVSAAALRKHAKSAR